MLIKILRFIEIRHSSRSGDLDITKQFEIVKLSFLSFTLKIPVLKAAYYYFLSSIVARGPKVRPQKAKDTYIKCKRPLEGRAEF